MSPALNPHIVTKPRQLTVEWAKHLINSLQNPALQNTTIDKMEIISIDVGTTTRIRLKVEHNADGVLPKRWFVKLPSLSLRAKAITVLPRLLPTEIKFYNELANQIPLAIPRMIAARSHLVHGSTLVMNDVSEQGALPGKAGDALTEDQAFLVIEKLASFHCRFIEKAGHDRNLRWLAGPVRRLEDALGSALAVPLMQRGLRLAENNIPSSLHQPALAYARNRRQVMKFLGTSAPTLVHHDCHPGNLFWHDGQPGFLDWQMVRLGEGISDVSYFMATALPPETRRKCELDILRKYHELMSANSKLASGFEQLFARYRVHLAYPFEAMALTLAVGGLMERESNLEMLRRAVAAVNDHGSLQKALQSQ